MSENFWKHVFSNGPTDVAWLLHADYDVFEGWNGKSMMKTV